MSRQRPRFWSKMSNKELIQYAKAHGLHNITPLEAMQKDKNFYHAICKRGLNKQIFHDTKRRWSNMTDAQIIAYTKHQGFFGQPAKKAIKEDYHLYYTLGQRGLRDIIFKSKLKNWKDFSDKDFINYAKRQGIYRVDRSKALEQDRLFYRALLWNNPDLAQKIFSERKKALPIDWDAMSDDEVIEYGRKQGLYGLNPREVGEKKSVFYKQLRKRGIVDKFCKYLKIPRSDIESFLLDDSRAQAIASISSMNGYNADAVRILTELWPNRFPNYAQLIQELPKIVPKISGALGPLDFGKLVRRIFDAYLPKVTAAMRDLGDLLYKIGREEYQTAFNKDPKATVENLNQLKKSEKGSPEVRNIFDRIESYYRGVLEFSIPGYGTLEDLA